MGAPAKPVPILVTLFDEQWRNVILALRMSGAPPELGQAIQRAIDSQTPRGKR